MRVRIVNDGKPGYTTRIYTEDGRALEYVTEADIHYEASAEIPTVKLTMILPMTDLIADAEIKHVCPYCGRPIDEEGKPI